MPATLSPLSVTAGARYHCTVARFPEIPEQLSVIAHHRAYIAGGSNDSASRGSGSLADQQPTAADTEATDSNATVRLGIAARVRLDLCHASSTAKPARRRC